MIIIVKRINIILISIICFFSYLTYMLYDMDNNAAFRAAIATAGKYTVIVDAGHGGEDGGAQSADGTLEKDLNLKIALYLREYLENEGCEVIMTRTEDKAIYDADKTTIRTKKISDMHNRKKIIDTSNADLFISIHMNTFGQSQYKGVQVFYTKSNENSKELGKFIQKSLAEGLGGSNKREAKPADSNIYLLKKTPMPAILIECGFLSNPEETALLKSEEYQRKIAMGIKNCVIEWSKR